MNPQRVETRPEFRHWNEILEQWICLNREIFEYGKPKFAAYSYRERPNIGILANAAVKAGWVALEECWSEKNGASCDDPVNGRADLWLWQNRRHERIEAKFTTDGFERLRDKIVRRHQAAKRDASRLRVLNDARNIALTFIVPRVTASEKKGFETGVGNLLDRCMDLKPDLLASVFPGWVPRLGADRNDQNKWAKGVIVIGDVV